MKLNIGALMLALVVSTLCGKAMAIDHFALAGDVAGRVNYCGNRENPGVLVYIPGRSFQAITDVDGKFQLSYVPSGKHRIVFEHRNQQIGALNSVLVRPNQVTRLGVIDICNVCPEIFAPVCGVDGVTYANECLANNAGMGIAHEGACDKFACTTEYAPVCGVDAETYANECLAKNSGVKIAYEGLCVELACTTEYAPVCGVNGITYGNWCEARNAEVEIAHEGECRRNLTSTQ